MQNSNSGYTEKEIYYLFKNIWIWRYYHEGMAIEEINNIIEQII